MQVTTATELSDHKNETIICKRGKTPSKNQCQIQMQVHKMHLDYIRTQSIIQL